MIKINEVVKSKQGSYRIILNDNKELIVTEKTLINHHLYKDKELNKEEIRVLEKEGKVDVYVAKALRYINVKMRSERELFDYLRKDDLTAKDISLIINLLKEDGYVDDNLLAKLLVEEWSTYGLNGPLLIKRNLQNKGISKDIIEQVLRPYSPDMQKRRVIEDLESVSKFPLRKSYYKALQSMQSKYARKGFENELIQHVFNDNEDLVNNCIDEQFELKKTMAKLKVKAYNPYQLKQQLHKLGFSQKAIDSYNEEEDDE